MTHAFTTVPRIGGSGYRDDTGVFLCGFVQRGDESASEDIGRRINNHHMAEALFKAFGKGLGMAATIGGTSG